MKQSMIVLLLPLLASVPGARAGAPAKGNAPKYTKAAPVYECSFDDDSIDEDFDNWPDRWTRRRGVGFPHYVKIAIKPRSEGSKNRCLRIDLDGGGAVVNSPLHPISPLYSYVLRGEVRTRELVHNKAFVELSFYDRDKRHLETHSSKPLTTANDWKPLSVGPITPKGRDAHFARIRLHLRPGRKSDLFGSAEFDNLWLGQLPHMKLRTTKPFNLFSDTKNVEVVCDVSGISDHNPIIRYEVIDVHGKAIQDEMHPLRFNDPEGRITWKPLAFDETTVSAGGAKNSGGYSAAIRFRPRLPRKGYYRLRISLVDQHQKKQPIAEVETPTTPLPATPSPATPSPATPSPATPSPTEHSSVSGDSLMREISLAVLGEQQRPRAGEFGWSIPGGEGRLELQELVQLLERSGVHWMKFPVWYEADDNERANALSEFAERLSVHLIEMVGVLDQPPESTRELFGTRKNGLLAAAVFDGGPCGRRSSIRS